MHRDEATRDDPAHPPAGVSRDFELLLIAIPRHAKGPSRMLPGRLVEHGDGHWRLAFEGCAPISGRGGGHGCGFVRRVLRLFAPD